MPKTYPNIGSISNGTKRKRCIVHKDIPAVKRVDVQITYMRGDDKVYMLCADCVSQVKQAKTGDELNDLLRSWK